MSNKNIFAFIASIIITLSCSNTFATQFFLDQWRVTYPSSSSGDIGCQLCHLGREGGSPWNAYGQDVRVAFNNPDLPFPRDIVDAFIVAEEFNSDNDEPSINNITEINANTQPGWRTGQVNIAYDRDGFSIGVFSEPIAVNPIREIIESRDYSLELVDVADGFTSPVNALIGPISELKNQIFVLDQIGLIWRVDIETGDKSIYLDVSDRLVELGAFEIGGYDERGLLGFAFHPNFTNNGLLYLYTSEPALGVPDFSTLTDGQSANHQSVILELTISNITDTQDIAIVESERELLRIDQPQFNHNGGALIFDTGNNLYISLGDGGSADDQGIGHSAIGNGSDPSNPLGSILRINPLGNNSNNGAYGIPNDNPFIDDNEILNEIYAYGFRNPWRLSFDKNGDLYAADVGQNDIEEINLVKKGQHYGWPIREGSFFFDNNDEFNGIITTQFPINFPLVDLIDPVLQYDHDEGISVTGGYVYRGSENPKLVGQYIFGDFLRRIFVGNLSSGEINQINLTPDIFIYSFMQDNSGELYFMGNATTGTSGSTGKLVKLQSTFVDEDTCFPIATVDKEIAVICL